MLERRYLYSMPHGIGADKFDRLLPDFRPTALDQVMLCGLPKAWNIEPASRLTEM